MEDRISRSQIDRAGKIIRQHRDDAKYYAAIEIVNRWREQHILSMDFYFDVCNDIVSKLGFKKTVVAERLKRLSTIIDKLDRFGHMRLSDMQDIGGVRVILDDIQFLELFDMEIQKLPTLKSCKDYLTKPKSSGYRGRHLIFKRDDVLTEIQLRTKLEHLWATSVETVDIICGTSMKTKQSGEYWQKFFELTSSVFAYMENLPTLPQHESWSISELCEEIRSMMAKYPIEKKLETYAATHGAMTGYKRTRDSYYAVITFDSCNNKTTIAYYRENEHHIAIQKYEELEKVPCFNNVLVSVNNLRKLHDAYPNYFKDISRFKEIVKAMLDFKYKKV